jgi:hypothetical protein
VRRVREVRAWGEARSASSRTQRRVQRKRKGSPREVNNEVVNEVNTTKQAVNNSEMRQSILVNWAMDVNQSIGIAPVMFADPTTSPIPILSFDCAPAKCANIGNPPVHVTTDNPTPDKLDKPAPSPGEPVTPPQLVRALPKATVTLSNGDVALHATTEHVDCTLIACTNRTNPLLHCRDHGA